MPRFIGYDGQHVARVFAEHPNYDVAETWCREEIWRYLRTRPDTGPFHRWTVEHVISPSAVAGHGVKS